MTAKAPESNDNNNSNKRQVNATELLSKIRADFELPESPDVMELMEGQRLVAIGDIHGDLQHLQNCLKAGGIIRSTSRTPSSTDKNNADNSNNNSATTWCAGNTILVQVGDVLDRGQQELQCLRLLCKLAREAKQAGGAVILLWGNHEVDNAVGDFECATDLESFEKEFGPTLDCCIDEDWKAMNKQPDKKRYWNARNRTFTNKTVRKDPARLAVLGPGGLLAEPLLSRFKVAVCVGKTVLVHGSLTLDQLDGSSSRDCCGRESLSKMNATMREWILKPIKKTASSFGDRGDLAWKALCTDASVFQDTFWSRAYSEPANQIPKNASKTRKRLEEVLDSLQCDRMVVGHTIQEEINCVFEGQLWRIDTGSALLASAEGGCEGMVPTEVLEVIGKENVGNGNSSSCSHREEVFVSRRVSDEEGYDTILTYDASGREVLERDN